MQRVKSRLALYELMIPGGYGAELGVLDGLNAQGLWRRAKPAVLTLVDLWQGTMRPHREIDGEWREQVITGEDAYRAVLDRFEPERKAGRVQVWARDTVAWLGEQPASWLDWIYLDSAHDDFHVMRELHQSYRVVKDGGWIMGHDYTGVCPGVVSAVDRFCRQFSQSIEILTDEPQAPILNRQPWMPETTAFNSFAIRVSK